MARSRVCGHPGCPVIVTEPDTRCPAHRKAARQHERRFQTGATAYNSARWMRLRDQVRQEQPHCVNARRQVPGCTLLTDVIDHRIPHRGDPALFYDRSNLQGMCASCHGRKTGAEVGGGGVEGW